MKRKERKDRSKSQQASTTVIEDEILDESKAAAAPGVLDKFLPRPVADFLYVELWKPVDASSLVFLRILWGIIMMYESWTYTVSDYAKVRYLQALLIHFKYYGFEWVHLWPGNGMEIHVQVMIVLAFFVTIGFFYHISAFLFFLAFSFLFLQEMTLYLNHFYLVCIFSFMFIFLPAANCFSVDAKLFPAIRSRTVPYWSIWSLKLLISVVYVYAGIAKFNVDWLRGEPLIHWLAKRKALPLLGYFFQFKEVAVFMSYGGLLLDLIIAPLMSFRAIRYFSFPFCVFFHVSNKFIFNIGIFPWMMLASTTIYFDPDWIPRTIRLIMDEPYKPIVTERQHRAALKTKKRVFNKHQILVLVCLAIFMTHQLVIPLRHFFYPGDVNWTEEGHRWSWRMKLRDKRAAVKFFITDQGITENVPLERLLAPKQERKMSCRPELIHLFAHELAAMYEKTMHRRPKVTAEVICSLNYRTFQHMVEPGYDLASVPPWTWPNDWVIPLVPLDVTDSPYLVHNFTDKKIIGDS